MYVYDMYECVFTTPLLAQSSITGNRPSCIKNSLSQPLSNLYLKSASMGEVLGMRAALELSATLGESGDCHMTLRLILILVRTLLAHYKQCCLLC